MSPQCRTRPSWTSPVADTTTCMRPSAPSKRFISHPLRGSRRFSAPVGLWRRLGKLATFQLVDPRRAVSGPPRLWPSTAMSCTTASAVAAAALHTSERRTVPLLVPEAAGLAAELARRRLRPEEDAGRGAAAAGTGLRALERRSAEAAKPLAAPTACTAVTPGGLMDDAIVRGVRGGAPQAVMGPPYRAVAGVGLVLAGRVLAPASPRPGFSLVLLGLSTRAPRAE